MPGRAGTCGVLRATLRPPVTDSFFVIRYIRTGGEVCKWFFKVFLQGAGRHPQHETQHRRERGVDGEGVLHGLARQLVEVETILVQVHILGLGRQQHGHRYIIGQQGVACVPNFIP